MHLSEIQEINRRALERAKMARMDAADSAMACYPHIDHKYKFLVYVAAVVVGVVVYMLLKKYHPSMVMTMQQGQLMFNQMRAVVASVVAGLLVVLVYYLYERYVMKH